MVRSDLSIVLLLLLLLLLLLPPPLRVDYDVNLQINSFSTTISREH